MTAAVSDMCMSEAGPDNTGCAVWAPFGTVGQGQQRSISKWHDKHDAQSTTIELQA